MLHKKFDFDLPTMLRDEETQREREGEYRISDQEAVRCALSIPEEFVPTPHKDFIKDLAQEKQLSDRLTNKKPSIQNGNAYYLNDQTILVKDRERKLRSAFAKYKKWDEAERCKVEKLEDDKVIVNGSLVIDVNHTNYVREQDVVLELDEDWKTCEMPDPPEKTELNCHESTCRLGCVCQSINQVVVGRGHCGKAKCIFECACQQTFANGDDGDIRSRLRPRVSLLNWRYMEATERDKDPPPVNYRQLERGAAVYPRMRRVAVAPQRFRNEYIMSHKYTDTLRRERRKAVTGISKFIRKPPVVSSVVKRDGHSSLFRRNYGVKGVKGKEQGRMINLKPCTVSIDPIHTFQSKKNAVLNERKFFQKPPPPQSDLIVPPLIQVLTQDAQTLLRGLHSLFFFAWTLQSSQPKAVIYKMVEGDMLKIPWLYLPIPSSGESWIFHQVSDDLEASTFTYIPEINCVIPSKALQVHFNTAHAKKKGVALKILWIGQDSRKRMGSIYIFPQLPGILVCGPFPKNQIKSRYNGTSERVDNALKLGPYVDTMSKKRYMGDDQSWSTFFENKSQQAYNSVKENLLNDEDEDEEGLDEDEFMLMNLPAPSPPPQMDTSTTSTPRVIPPMPKLHRKPVDKLCVSWNDASKLFSVRPGRQSN